MYTRFRKGFEYLLEAIVILLMSSLTIVVLVTGMRLSMSVGTVNRWLPISPGFVPPALWPAASNSLVEVKDVSDVFPDINYRIGNSLVQIVFLVQAVFGIG